MLLNMALLFFILGGFMKNKHLTLEQRTTIADELYIHSSFKRIALLLNKDPGTISKEVRKHLQHQTLPAYNMSFNDCKHCHLRTCKMKRICHLCHFKSIKYCSQCTRCMQNCNSYEQFTCPQLLKPPYCCNGCSNRQKCRLEKRYYNATKAQQDYELCRTESRSGIYANEAQIKHMNTIVSPLLKNGHSIHHILINHRDELMISQKTLYNYVDYSLFDSRNIDMPRKIRMRPRKQKSTALKVDRKCRIGRTYDDYKNYLISNPDVATREIDSVVGVHGGSVLLTIHFVEHKFQLAFLRPSNDSKSVTDIFNLLYERLGTERYKRLFPLLLGDNGSEFSNPSAVECDEHGEIRSRVFYCNPGASYEKGSCENNHEMIRRVIPKGVDFGDYTQKDIALMMSHINSYARASLGDKTPYESMKFHYGEDILEILNTSYIPPCEIVLKPSLLSK